MTLDDTTVSFAATIKGRVQGVNFRLYTSNSAEQLGVSGWVRNQPDGSVKVLAQGRKSTLHDFIAILRAGPANASVTGLDVTWMSAGESLGKFYVVW